MRVKIRDEGLVKNKAVYVALAYNSDGEKDPRGLRIAQTEGAKFWLRVVNELKIRGVNDILIAVVDGLSVYPNRWCRPASCICPQQSCLRRLEGPQGDPALDQVDLSGRERRGGGAQGCGARGPDGASATR